MRWLAVLAMLLVMPVAAHAQAPSPLAPATPDTIRVLVLGLQHVGWLPPGTPRMDCPQLYDEAGRVRLCTRAEVIDRARWSVANREDVPEGAPVFLPRSEAERVRGRAIIGTLVRAGALPGAFEDTLRRAYEDTLVGRASFARTAHEQALELAAALVGDAERLHPAVLEPAVEGLVSLGLLPPESGARLLADARAGRFTPVATVEYIARAVPVEQNDEATRDSVAARVQRIVGRLRASSVADLPLDSSDVVAEPNPGTPGRFRLLARFRGRAYRFGFSTLHSRASPAGMLFEPTYGNLFARLLRDVGSPYRLAGLEPLDGRPEPWLVALTRSQARALHRQNPSGYRRYDRSFLPLNTYDLDDDYDTPPIDSLEAAFDQLVAVGLFAHVAPEGQAQIRSGLISLHRGGTDELLRLQNGRGPLGWLSEYDTRLPSRHPYARVVRYAAEISRGAFRPTRVADDLGRRRRSGTVRFEVDGRAWAVPFRHPRQQRYEHAEFIDVDSAAVRAIFRAANEDVTTGRFFYCAGPLAGFHFLTPPQRGAAEALGLRFEDP